MCRSIKPLFNIEPPTDDEDIRAAALQFVRKVSSYRKPSKVNELAFNAAVDAVASITRDLLQTLVTNTPRHERVTATRRDGYR